MSPSPDVAWTCVFQGYTNAGVLAALATVLTAFARPAALGVPYTLTVVAAVWRWAQGGAACMPRAVIRAGQLYTGEPFERLPLLPSFTLFALLRMDTLRHITEPCPGPRAHVPTCLSIPPG